MAEIKSAPVRKYRLLHSQHIVRNPSYDPAKPIGEDNRRSIVHQPGDIVEGVDLDRRHPNKFVALDPYTAAPVSAPKKTEKAKTDLDKEYGNLDQMDLSELKEVAASEEIDLGTATTKAEVLKKLRGK